MSIRSERLPEQPISECVARLGFAARCVETVIERRGVPVALIVPYPGRTPAFGTGGPVVIHDDFDVDIMRIG